MRSFLLLLCLLIVPAAAFATATPATIWVSTRTDGLPGTGTQSDPFDLSSPAKFDAFFAARYAAYYRDSSSYDAVVFHFLPGNYASNSTGIMAVSGWQLIGAGQDSTVLKFPSVSYASSAAKRPADVTGVNTNWGSTDITVQDLTLDGGARDTRIPISAGFVMPGPRESVTITVPDTGKLAVGKWYYVQDMAMTNGKQMWWGMVTCTAINGRNVTLQNAEVPVAGTVTGDTTAGSPVVKNISSSANLEQDQPITCSACAGDTTIVSVDSPRQVTLGRNATATAAGVTLSYGVCFTGNVSGPVLATACLFPAANRAGVILQSNNIVIERVTVQDVSIPHYEGAVLELGNQPRTHKVGSGNIIDHCTVRDVFGIYAAYIAANSANYDNRDPVDTGITEQVQITNNTVIGNGYYLGIGLAGNSNTTISGNTISNVGACLYCDTGFNTGFTITGNNFSGTNGIHLGVGAGNFNNCLIKNNVITLTSVSGSCLYLTLNSSNLTVSGNILTIGSPADGNDGIVAGGFGPGSHDIVITNNQIASSLLNQGIDANANQILSLDQINQELAAQAQANNSGTASANAPSSSAPPAGAPASTASTGANTGETTSSSAPAPAGESSAPGHASGRRTLARTQASLVERINRAVAIMQALTDAEAASADTSDSRSPGQKQLDEKKLVLQLDSLVRELNEDATAVR